MSSSTWCKRDRRSPLAGGLVFLLALSDHVACTPAVPPASDSLRPMPAPTISAPQQVQVPAEDPAPSETSEEHPIPVAQPVVVDFAIGKTSFKLVGQRNGETEVSTVDEIRLGDTVIYPLTCMEGSTGSAGLCLPGHAQLRKVLESAKPLRLFATDRSSTQLDLLFTGSATESGHCTVGSYWMLRVDKRGAFATAPLAGCFWEPGVAPSRAPDQPDEPATWPPKIWPAAAGFGEPGVFTLDLRTLRAVRP